MLLFNHRVNTVKKLISTPYQFGVEIDLRSNGDDIILHHDPFCMGELFTEWLESYNHSGIILNVKEEGLEKKILSILSDPKFNKINNYFFLDQSFPFLVRSINNGQNQCALRYSEYESVETVLKLEGKVDWVWIDCFNHYPITAEISTLLHNSGFKLCAVSPELQGRGSEKFIHEAAIFFLTGEIKIDAVCTKRCDIWNKYIFDSCRFVQAFN